jgi:hypothetical protein
MAPVIGRAEKAHRRHDVRAHHTPDAPAVRAHAWFEGYRARLVAWAWREPGPAVGGFVGLCIGGPGGAQRAVEVGQAPGWAGALAGAFLGITAGLLVGHLVVITWAAGRRSVPTWLSRRLRPIWRWLVARWTALRVRLTGRGGDLRYQPFATVAAHDDSDGPQS